jgi:hypothetical protein
MFDIYLTDQAVPEVDPGARALYGKIRIGEFSDTFIASLRFWNRERYEEHWMKAVQRVVEGADRSTLVTSYNEPSDVPDEFLFWWPVYRDNGVVYIQNQMLFFEQLEGPFSETAPWESVGQRHTVNEEGLRISEWPTTVDSLREFLVRRESSRR